MNQPHGRLTFSDHVVEALTGSGVTVIVTGAGGWLGRATLEMLDAALGPKALEERVRAYGSSSRVDRLRSGTKVAVSSLAELGNSGSTGHENPELVAHYAYLTRERASEMATSEYLERNRAISAAVAAYAQATAPAGIFLPSSGAVYGSAHSLSHDLEQNPYGMLKLEDERRFLGLQTGGGHPERTRVVVFRVFNLAGPFLNKADRYALGTILTDLGRGGPIRLRADHPVVRSYVHVRDVVDLGFAAMLGVAAPPPEPIDTAGEREIEVGELARLAADVLGRPTTEIVRPPVTGSADRYVGDGSALAALAAAARITLAPLEEQISDTAAFLGVGRRS